jgi:hypothetical protein
MVRQSAFFENLLLPLFLACSQLSHSLTAPVRMSRSQLGQESSKSEKGRTKSTQNRERLK